MAPKGEMRHAVKVHLETLKGRDYLEDISLDGRLIIP